MAMQKVLFSLFHVSFIILLINPMPVSSDPIIVEPGSVFVKVMRFADGFNGPFGLALDGVGNLYVANEGFGVNYPGTTISRVTPDGVVATFADGFETPAGLAFNPVDGKLYVSDDHNMVYKVAPTGQIEEFFRVPEGPGNPNAIGLLTFDSSWNLYVVTHGGGPGAIYKVTPGGEWEIFVDSDDIPGGFHGPQAIAFDDEANAYTSDHSGRVYKITPERSASVFATFPVGTQGGLAFDENGNLYVASTEPAIYKVSPDGGAVSLFVIGFAQTMENYPRGLIFDEEGSLYVSEFGTGIIWKVVSKRGSVAELIREVANLNLAQGIENSLEAKLESAMNALDDVNQNNDVAAINSLHAFINAVEAQRGNKLTNEQADKLVADANNIIASLSDGSAAPAKQRRLNPRGKLPTIWGQMKAK